MLTAKVKIEEEKTMFAWIAENIGTIVISLILAGVVAAIIVYMIKSRKQGKSSCGCGCKGCAMHGACHRQK